MELEGERSGAARAPARERGRERENVEWRGVALNGKERETEEEKK